MTVSQSWLALLDAGDFVECCNQAAPYFMSSITPKQFKAVRENFIATHGKVSSRSFKIINYSDEQPNLLKGECLVFNTFFALSDQEEQGRCFANVAKRLRRGGLFLIDAFVPDPARFKDDQIVKVTDMRVDEVLLETSIHDRLSQRVMSQQVVIGQSGVKLYPIQIRYAWPAELDLMARLAGMRLRERWGDWQRGPFVAESTRHISIYDLP